MKRFDWLNKHPFIKYLCPAYIVMLIIVFFSLTTEPFAIIGMEDSTINFNLLHGLAYFILSFLMGIAFRQSKQVAFRKNHYFFAILCCFAFSGFIELMQFFVPGRTPSFPDLFFNLRGTISAQFIRLILKK